MYRILAVLSLKCKHSDTVCLKNVIQLYVKQAAKGIPEIDLPPLEPYLLETISIKKGKQSPVAINLNFYDSLISGLSTIGVDRVV